MDIEQSVEAMAGWLKQRAATGRPMPSNIARTAVRPLGMSPSLAKDVLAVLVMRHRLVRSRGRGKIDGIEFVRPIRMVDHIDKIKTTLRRHYPMVIDPRTVDEPTKVATGKPKELLVGAHVMTWDQAVDAAVAPRPA